MVQASKVYTICLLKLMIGWGIGFRRFLGSGAVEDIAILAFVLFVDRFLSILVVEEFSLVFLDFAEVVKFLEVVFFPVFSLEVLEAAFLFTSRF